MKILQINSVCGYGSTGRIATDLYKIYEEHGHECIIAYGRGTSPKGYKTIKIGSNLDNYTHVIKTRILDKHGFGSRKATEKFIEKVKIYNPDIIHLHNIHGYYINIEVLFEYLKKSNKKVIWTLHDCWAFTGHCSYFDYIGCDKWKTECFNCKQKLEYPTSNFNDNSKNNFNKKKELFIGIKDMTIITPSKWLANLVKESFLKEYKVEVINNGIDTNIFRPIKSDFRKKYGIENKKIILGVASVWDRRKGLSYFIDMSKHLDEKYKIVIVGVTEKQKRELPKNIIGIVRTENVEELVKIYSDSDIFFNPTSEDNFPTTNLEAMACGTRAIGFDVGGNCEVLNKINGIIEKNNLNIQSWFNYDLDKEKLIEIAKEYDKKKKFNEYISKIF